MSEADRARYWALKAKQYALMIEAYDAAIRAEEIAKQMDPQHTVALISHYRDLLNDYQKMLENCANLATVMKKAG